MVFCDRASFTHDYVFNYMTPNEIFEANIALDLILEEEKKAMDKEKAKAKAKRR